MVNEPWRGKRFVKEGDNYPTTYVDWNDAVEFCGKLTKARSRCCSFAWQLDVSFAHRSAMGLHEMHGNEWEWRGDGYQKNPPGGVNPEATAETLYRVNRGGSWNGNAGHCRSASRRGFRPDYRNYDLGFRVAAVPVK